MWFWLIWSVSFMVRSNWSWWNIRCITIYTKYDLLTLYKSNNPNILHKIRCQGRVCGIFNLPNVKKSFVWSSIDLNFDTFRPNLELMKEIWYKISFTSFCDVFKDTMKACKILKSAAERIWVHLLDQKYFRMILQTIDTLVHARKYSYQRFPQ